MSAKASIIIINLSQNNLLHLLLLQASSRHQLRVTYDKLDQTLLPQLEKFTSRHRLSWTEVSAVGLILPHSFVAVRLALAVANTLAWVHKFKIFLLPQAEIDQVSISSYKKYQPVAFLLPEYASGPRISQTKRRNKIKIER